MELDLKPCVRSFILNNLSDIETIRERFAMRSAKVFICVSKKYQMLSLSYVFLCADWQRIEIQCNSPPKPVGKSVPACPHHRTEASKSKTLIRKTKRVTGDHLLVRVDSFDDLCNYVCTAVELVQFFDYFVCVAGKWTHPDVTQPSKEGGRLRALWPFHHSGFE